MRLIAVILAALVLVACGGKSTAPVSSGTATTTTGTTAPPAAAMSFDCAKPANKAQQLVCGDPQLTELDRRMQTAYQQALARPGADAATLTTAQSAFTTIRDGCGDFVDARTCLLEAYQTRVVELAIADPATVAPPVVTYNCPADSGPLTAQFYNDLDPKTAVLDWKGTRIILFIQPSGSGARYGRQGDDYWEHQGEVTLDLSGTKFVCHTR
ncbi:MAG: MliC family protein [Mycobacterium sp.]